MKPSTLKKAAAEYQRTFHLTDWRITARSVEGFIPDDGHLGDCDPNVDYRTATILIYPAAIAVAANGDEFDVLVHEFGEIVAAQACGILPDEQFGSDIMMRVRDRFAEHLMRIVGSLERK